jgi:hypothetical protein
MQSSTSDRAGFEQALAATDRPLRDAALWLGMLGPPVLWLVQFQIIYALVLPVCTSHSGAILAFVSVVFAGAIIACGFIGWRSRAPVNECPARIKVVRQFMAILSLMSMLLFLLVVMAQLIATAMHSPCVI